MPAKIARSVIAIVLGFAVFFGVVRLLARFAGNPDEGDALTNYLLFSVLITVAGAMIAGYATARVAAAHEFPHAAGLGLLMVILSVVSMRQQGIAAPGWYQTTIAGCGPISAMLGAAIRLLTKRGQTAKRNTSAPASRP